MYFFVTHSFITLFSSSLQSQEEARPISCSLFNESSWRPCGITSWPARFARPSMRSRWTYRTTIQSSKNPWTWAPSKNASIPDFTRRLKNACRFAYYFSVNCLIDWTTDWLIDWYIHSFVQSSNDWLIDWLRTIIRCFQDFSQMFSNCYTYNPPGHVVYQWGQKLEADFVGRIKTMPKVEEVIAHPGKPTRGRKKSLNAGRPPLGRPPGAHGSLTNPMVVHPEIPTRQPMPMTVPVKAPAPPKGALNPAPSGDKSVFSVFPFYFLISGILLTEVTAWIRNVSSIAWTIDWFIAWLIKQSIDN